METSKVEKFLSGTLVSWFMSCVEDQNSLITYSDLVDGVLLHSVYLQMDPKPLRNEIIASNGDVNLRIKNLESILENLKQYYEVCLGHIILKLPNATNLGKDPELHVEDMKLLLLLILGCAVQCPDKEKFIERMKTFKSSTQHQLVEYIKQVTEYPEIVLNQDALESVNMGSLFTHVKNLIQERNYYCEKSQNLNFSDIEIQGNSTVLISHSEELTKSSFNSTTKSEFGEVHHSPELVDLKIKLRKLQRESEEKSEFLLECKAEMEEYTRLLSKLTQENHQLMMEARHAKFFRDELDVAIEKAERVDRLETEISRYREKLNDIEYYKTRTEELREDNKVLINMKETLEEELKLQRKKFEKIPDFEAEILQFKKLLNDVSLEQSADREKYVQLQEENNHLQSLVKSKNETSINESLNDSDGPEIMDKSLSEQLKNSTHAQIMKLELENRRLLSEIQSIKENSFEKNSPRILELEKDKKELQEKLDSFINNKEQLAQDLISRIVELEKMEKDLKLKIDCLTKNNEQLTQRNSNLDYTCNTMKKGNENLQDTLKKLKEQLEDQITLELDHERFNNDYVKHLHERDELKADLEDCHKKVLNLKESNEKLQKINKQLLNEQEDRERELNTLRILQEEHVRLQEDFTSLFATTDMLRTENAKLERENGDINKKLIDALQENLSKGARFSSLELQMRKLYERYCQLYVMSSEGEVEKQKLIEKLGELTCENKVLYRNAVIEKEIFFAEERKYTELIVQMTTKNVKLEQKVIDFYKYMPPSVPANKRHSFGSTLVKKVRKAGTMLGLTRRSSCSFADELRRTDSDVQSCEFEFNFDENHFPPENAMTLDSRLLRGKKGLRDRLSLGIFRKGKLPLNSDDSEISTGSTTSDHCVSETLQHFKKETESTDAESTSKSVCEVIPEIEDVNSVENDNQEKTQISNETEEEKDLENYLNSPRPTKAESKTSIWHEYGCA